MSKIIVIGGNHAGTSCVNTILENYKGNDVVIFDKSSNMSFLGCGIALWIGQKIENPNELFYSSKEQLEEKGATVHLETEVTEIDYIKKIVFAKSKDGKTYEESYDKLVLATGARTLIPQVEGVNLENIHQIKTYENAKEIIDKLNNDKSIKNVSIIGAGYVGVELTEAFKTIGKNVTIIDMANTVLPTYYDSRFTDLMSKKLVENEIDLRLDRQIMSFRGENNKVTAVKTDVDTIETDLVLWAVGFRPNNEIGKKEIKLHKNGAFLVDRAQKTSIEDVYAVGDCSTVLDNAVEKENYIALASNAVRSGMIAGHSVCGNELLSVGVQGSNAISVFGLNLFSTGLTKAKAEANGIDVLVTDYKGKQRASFIKENFDVDIRIVFEKDTRRIIGAQIASDYDVSMAIHTFSVLIQEKVTIDKLKVLDTFFLPHFNQPYNYITMAALNAPNE